MAQLDACPICGDKMVEGALMHAYSLAWRNGAYNGGWFYADEKLPGTARPLRAQRCRRCGAIFFQVVSPRN